MSAFTYESYAYKYLIMMLGNAPPEDFFKIFMKYSKFYIIRKSQYKELQAILLEEIILRSEKYREEAKKVLLL